MKSKKFKLSAIVFYSVIIALALGLPRTALATPVPDTGQTLCYGDAWNVITCPQPGEPFYGQDAQYGTNTQSYTDLGNGIVRDNVTGLEWQEYTNGAFTWEHAIEFTNSQHGWRLPTIKELATIVDHGLIEPSINMIYFFLSPVQERFWSSTESVGDTTAAWYVNFNYGRIYAADKTAGFYVRLVRGVQSNNNFVDNGDGTVTDTSTGLMWQQDGLTKLSWAAALAYCENLTLAGYDDWRLPNINELQSIVDYSRYQPAIDTTYFHMDPNSDYPDYVSSTTNLARATERNLAWQVEFVAGFATYCSKDPQKYVRAVRGRPVELTTTTSSTSSTITTTIPSDTTTTTITESTTTTIEGGTTTTTTVSTNQCAAEAIYGSDSEETELLHEYRDKVLSKTATGRQMIKAYYEASPAVAELLQQNERARTNARKVLDAFMPAIRKKVKQ